MPSVPSPSSVAKKAAASRQPLPNPPAPQSLDDIAAAMRQSEPQGPSEAALLIEQIGAEAGRQLNELNDQEDYLRNQFDVVRDSQVRLRRLFEEAQDGPDLDRLREILAELQQKATRATKAPAKTKTPQAPRTERRRRDKGDHNVGLDIFRKGLNRLAPPKPPKS